MPIYPVLRGLRHDGRRYRLGDTVRLSEDEAAAVAVGVLGAPSEGDGDEAETLTASEEAALVPVLRAIQSLVPGAEGVWLNDGRPNATALATVLGRAVSAAERDAAWQAYPHWSAEPY